MTAQPSADELLAAVSDFIERIAPELKDRDIFLARVAVNALATVRREYTAGPMAQYAATERLGSLLGRKGDFETLTTALSHAIHEGVFDHGEDILLAHLKASAIDQVRIDQPNYSGLKAASAV